MRHIAAAARGASKKRRSKGGFTLIELIVVLAVLAIIALIAIPNFTKIRREAAIKADIRSAEQVQKIATMLLIEETLEAPSELTLDYSSGELELIPGESLALEASYSPGTRTRAIRDAFKHVQAPQEKHKTGYKVLIDYEEQVEVHTIGGQEPGAGARPPEFEE